MTRCQKNPNLKTGIEGCLDKCTADFNTCTSGCEQRFPDAVKAEDGIEECGEESCPSVCSGE
jgi:hypothetical protein